MLDFFLFCFLKLNQFFASDWIDAFKTYYVNLIVLLNIWNVVQIIYYQEDLVTLEFGDPFGVYTVCKSFLSFSFSVKEIPD